MIAKMEKINWESLRNSVENICQLNVKKQKKINLKKKIKKEIKIN